MNNIRMFAFMAAAMSVSLNVQSQNLDSIVLATVNGEPIYEQSVELIAQTFAVNEKLSTAEILEELISLKLLSQAARKVGLDKSDTVAMAVKLQESQTLANAYTSYITNGIDVSSEELRSEYDRQVRRLEKQDFRTSHIQFETELEASAAMVSLANGAEFIELAKTLSVSPDGLAGGDLGWNAYGAGSFERSEDVEQLEVNNITKPLQTSFGWHIFKLTDTRGAVIPSYETIKTKLQEIVVREKIKEHLIEIRSNAVVEMASKLE